MSFFLPIFVLLKKTLIFAETNKTKTMSTITLTYDSHNSLANSILQSILQSGVFSVADKSDAYNPEFVEKIKTSEMEFSEGNYKSIKTDDLWK